MPVTDIQQSLDNLKLERDAIVLYDALASIEKDAHRAGAFRTIAGNERRHAEIWASKLREQGADVPPPGPPRGRVRAIILLARLFLVNWFLFLFNLVLVGFPCDSGRMLQCILWPNFGYRQATLFAIRAGFVTMFAVIIASIVIFDPLLMLFALFIYISCKQEWIVLETGGEDSLFGYDFSQGYTSLERDEPAPPKPKQPNFIKRWLQRRAERKAQLEQELQIAEEQRMDQLLDKIARHGKESLTDEEQVFLNRVAKRYRKKSP